MEQTKSKIHTSHNWQFWVHVFITVLSWFATVLFSWYLVVPIYALVLLQFMVFNRCVMNGTHELNDGDDGDSTFYSYLLESLGVKTNRPKLKKFVRRYLYFVLTAIALTWQIVLNQQPLLFFRH